MSCRDVNSPIKSRDYNLLLGGSSDGVQARRLEDEEINDKNS